MIRGHPLIMFALGEVAKSDAVRGGCVDFNARKGEVSKAPKKLQTSEINAPCKLIRTLDKTAINDCCIVARFILGSNEEVMYRDRYIHGA